MKVLFRLLLISAIFSLSSAQSSDDVRIWGDIPFERGPDLCAHRQVYSQTRSSYMSEMVSLANSLMGAGAYGDEAQAMLEKFDELYDQHRNSVIHDFEQRLSLELEGTLKANLDQIYRSLPIKNKKIIFYYSSDKNEEKINYMAYGSYSFASSCQGEINVNVSLLDSRGTTQTFQATGEPNSVMSQIANEMFKEFQQMKFGEELNTSSGKVELVASNNGSFGVVGSLEQAKRQCEMNESRLPNHIELEDIAGYGAYNGGIDLGNKVWIVEQDEGLKIFRETFRPMPVRDLFHVSTRELYFFCVRNSDS